MKCKICGCELDGSKKFCKSCGVVVPKEALGEAVKSSTQKNNKVVIGACLVLLVVVFGVAMKGSEKKEADFDNHENVTEWDSAEEQYDDGAEEYTESQNEEEYFEESREFILPGSDSRYLSEEDLEGLTAEECRIARNELYARHGRIFTDEALQAYFESLDWYVPQIHPDDFDESMLNEYEVANRDLIVEYEYARGYR